ncbi:MAG: hypothetical protein KAI17_16225 [Thiotrichaceae bacterium]|nr:hypothetical protein [Thiotrichaceae bacterium]
MNTQNNSHDRIKTCMISVNKMILLSLLATTTSVLAEGSFQQNILLSPSSNMLLAEAKGRVMIYDGLKNETVNTAMTEQFDRIQNMMFVRTQYVQESGEYEAEDDCD